MFRRNSVLSRKIIVTRLDRRRISVLALLDIIYGKQSLAQPVYQRLNEADRAPCALRSAGETRFMERPISPAPVFVIHIFTLVQSRATVLSFSISRGQ